MMRAILPSQYDLLSVLRYDTYTGKLFWLERPSRYFKTGQKTEEHQASIWNSVYAGKEAFTAINDSGYFKGTLFRKSYRAHRVIFKMMTGVDPIEVDHIDGDRQNNRWVNLREVDRSANCQNTGLSKRNKTGAPGVHWYADNGGCWRAYVYIGGKSRYIGTFKTKKEAVAARREAQRQMGFHVNHGQRLGWDLSQEIKMMRRAG